MSMQAMEVLVDGLAFPEGPRWHDGNLWLSDMQGFEVLRLSPRGERSRVAQVPGGPSGIGFLPDGRLLVVSQHDRRVMRVEATGELREHADLRQFATWHCNDMIVDRHGRAYVGNYGDGSVPPDPPRPSDLVLVLPDGSCRIVAGGMEFPNGMAISADGGTLIVAETRSVPPRLTAFSISTDGSLSDRRVIATFGRELPDGICLDAEGAAWVASPFTCEALRVAGDGEIVDRVSTGDHGVYAVALGGTDGHTLFLCTSSTWLPEEARRLRSGAVRTLRVEVPAPAY
jgi:sugar lactone lactonase YvrE